MFCSNCGKEVKPDAQFCYFCGAPMHEDRSSTSKSGTGRFLPGFLSGAIAMILVAAVLFGTGIARLGGSKRSDAEAKIECDGFSSPEDAVTEYIEALKSKDLDRMISCFAIESYVENFDLQTYLETTQVFTPFNSGSQWPELGDFSEAMNVRQRETAVLNFIRAQYAVLFTNGLPDSRQYLLRDYSDYDELLDDFVSSNGEDALSQISFDREFVSWKHAVQTGLKKGEYTDRLSPYYFADALEPVFAEIEMDGETYIIGMDVAEYDGSWYILKPNIAMESDFSSGIMAE